MNQNDPISQFSNLSALVVISYADGELGFVVQPQEWNDQATDAPLTVSDLSVMAHQVADALAPKLADGYTVSDVIVRGYLPASESFGA